MPRRFLLLGICVPMLLGACGSDTVGPGDEVVFSAVIQDLLEVPVAPGTIERLLVSHPGQLKPVDRSIVHISQSTSIVRKSPTGLTVPATVEDLEIGQSAVFRIKPIELRSYPRQVFATRIEL